MNTDQTNDQADETPRIPRFTQYATEYQNPRDLLTDRLYQANGLSTILYGIGQDTLKQYADDIQDGVLWALHSLIHDAKIAADRLGRGAT